MGVGGAPTSEEAEDGSERRRRTLELRCDDVHPCSCDTVFRGSTPEELMAQAREHGELVHFFTPAFYRSRRFAAITRAVTGA